MPGEVLRRVLRSRRRALIGWVVGVVALLALVVFSYPAVRDQDSFAQMMEDYPDFVEQIMGLGGGLSITSPEGYLNSQVFANMLPLLLIICLVGIASRETAGDERERTLDLLLAHPVTRTRALLEKAGALLAVGVWLGAVAALTLILTAPLVEVDIGVGAFVGASLSSVAAGWVFGSLALTLGALTGNRAIAIGGSSALAVVTYVLWGLAPLITGLEFTNSVNPWYWVMAGDPIIHGVQGGNLLLLAAVTATFVATAVLGFRRRDLGV